MEQGKACRSAGMEDVPFVILLWRTASCVCVLQSNTLHDSPQNLLAISYVPVGLPLAPI